MDELFTQNEPAPPTEDHRRILKVRLSRDHVLRLHELRIVQGRSIASLLEKILDDYFQKEEESGNRLFEPRR